MAEASKEETSAQVSSTPVFGSASTFGAGGGFGGFSGAAAEQKPAKAEDAAAGEGEEEQAEEEDCSAEFQPIVQLQEVETVSGEEAENILTDFKCKLYRFDHDAGEWKERGVGQVRLLENKENKRIRLLHRQEKTLKIRANHILMPSTKLQEHSGSEKAWVWSAVDFADEVQKPELFCIRFASVERAQEFKKCFDDAVSKNTELLGEDAGAEEAAETAEPAKEAAPDAAEKLTEETGKLKVEENGKE
jgi:Ran-binding protein 1